MTAQFSHILTISNNSRATRPVVIELHREFPGSKGTKFVQMVQASMGSLPIYGKCLLICPFEKRSYYVTPLSVLPYVTFCFQITLPTVYARLS